MHDIFKLGRLEYNREFIALHPYDGSEPTTIYTGPLAALQSQLFKIEARFLGDYWRDRKMAICPHCEARVKVNPCWFCEGDTGIDDDRKGIWKRVLRCEDARGIILGKILEVATW